jgi:D-alanyl-lipoteichoic acid acyltransferase DltB (MBOAT superfamily)
MIANIVLILLPLFFFKYFQVFNNYVLQTLVENNLHWPLPKLEFLLPVGISFYTFVAIGYTVDVFNEEVKAEKNFTILTLFISFFPLILSGPIERASNLLPQFRTWKQINYAGITSGMKMMLWGYFMKLVVADRLGIYVDAVLNNINNHNGSTLLLASGLYPFQVYCDLGGYSLIAIGSAKVLGLDVIQNFRRPFFATSMAEFWRRWHISLITWLTDYVYTPLSFHLRKIGMKGVIIALMLTFLISGIWHGAALTFVCWGVLQGFYLGLEVITQKRRIAWEKKYNLNNNIFYMLSCMALTYVLFSISQIFGRAPDLRSTIEIFRKFFYEQGSIYLDITTLVFAIFGLMLVLLKDINDEFFGGKYSLFASKSISIRFSSYIIVMFAIILFGVFADKSFIYFQF